MTRLQTLRVEGHVVQMFVHLAGLPAAVQRLSILLVSSVDIYSWPSAGRPVDIELRSRTDLSLPEASGRAGSRGQLPGCRVKLQAARLIVEHEWADEDAVGGLLRWVKGSQAATVILEPVSHCEADEYADSSEDYLPVTVLIQRQGRLVSAWRGGVTLNLQGLLKELLRQCGSHGLSCGANNTGHGIWIGRAACQ